MGRKRLWEIVAAASLVLVVGLAAAGYFWLQNSRKQAQQRLVQAARECNAPLLVQLLQRGLSVNARDRSGQTPLEAAMTSDSQNREMLGATVRILLEHGASLETRGPLEQNVLVWAVERRFDNIALHALDKGADPNSEDVYRRTPLMFAAFNRSPSMVRTLLQRGAETERLDDEGRTALMWAAMAIGGNAEPIRELLKGGADVNNQDRARRTALIHAADAPGSEASVRELLRARANFRLRAAGGETALRAARRRQNRESARLLCAAGATE